MKKATLFLLAILLAGINSCKPTEKKAEESVLIEKPAIELKSDLMTPEVLWSFGRLSEPELSPDQKTILYGVTYYDIAQNKGNRELYTIGADGQNFKRVTTTKFSEYQAMCRPMGKKSSLCRLNPVQCRCGKWIPTGTTVPGSPILRMGSMDLNIPPT